MVGEPAAGVAVVEVVVEAAVAEEVGLVELKAAVVEAAVPAEVVDKAAVAKEVAGRLNCFI